MRPFVLLLPILQGVVPCAGEPLIVWKHSTPTIKDCRPITVSRLPRLFGVKSEKVIVLVTSVYGYMPGLAAVAAVDELDPWRATSHNFKDDMKPFCWCGAEADRYLLHILPD